MDDDLVAFGHDAALLVGVEEGGDGGDVERGGDLVPGEQLQDAGHPDAVAVLAPGEPADRLAAVAQLVRVVVGVERERDGAPRVTQPVRGSKGAAGPDVVDEGAPLDVGPLPGLHRWRCVRHVAAASGDLDGPDLIAAGACRRRGARRVRQACLASDPA